MAYKFRVWFEATDEVRMRRAEVGHQGVEIVDEPTADRIECSALLLPAGRRLHREEPSEQAVARRAESLLKVG